MIVRQEQQARDDGPQRGDGWNMSARQGLRSDGFHDGKIEQLRLPPQSVEAEQAVLAG